MWVFLANNILKYRIPLIILLGGITIFMGFQAQKIHLSYTLASVVPSDDPDKMYLDRFKEEFGEDGNIMAIGIKDSSVYTIENFKRFKYLTDELKRLSGVSQVIGLPNLQTLVKSSDKKSFDLLPVFKEIPDKQEELDSLLSFISTLRFYSGQLVNKQNGATLILITLDKNTINSEDRNLLINDIVAAGEAFEEITGIDAHYAGLPYVRSTNMTKIKSELNKFLILSILITAIILYAFFRSFKAVFFPLLVIGMIVIWVMGTLGILGYEITILTGLIPSIIVVIGIPNSVYMLNKYHQEYNQSGDKIEALKQVIKKIGLVTFITNFTTGIGFGVLTYTDITILREFGIVSSVNIMATFIVSLILIPSLYSFLDPPNVRHLKHLDFKILGWILKKLDHVVHNYRIAIFTISFVILGISIYGIFQIKALSYMVDDLPDKSPLKKDLAFFEENFSGIMPLEMVVDTGVKKGIQNIKNLKQIDEFEQFLDSLTYISQPVSVVSFVKAARQAYYNQDTNFYAVPNQRDAGFILQYLREDQDQKSLSQNFVDSTGQKIRISLKVADVGSIKMDSLVHQVIEPRIDEIFDNEKMKVSITGSTLLFIKGNKFLIDNLISSMIIAFVVIAIVMGLLFRNIKIILISLIPNIIPLVVTGGIMGLFGIPLKPSTALIFSIAFGISVDDSIHFLAKYRLELFTHKFIVPIAVSKSLKETGASMIYTSVILFFGFVIFTMSEFGGTVALGTLTSITLLCAMFANLTLLPALLLQFDTGKRDKSAHPLIEQYPEFTEPDTEEEQKQ